MEGFQFSPFKNILYFEQVIFKMRLIYVYMNYSMMIMDELGLFAKLVIYINHQRSVSDISAWLSFILFFHFRITENSK